ncbi:MAG: hypothetical protein COB04_18295 [Gammaproteobacteria bacterium]|nr:MAG: hypothetical protein COB04_18295 [Gammaproteobacteria bacterium]
MIRLTKAPFVFATCLFFLSTACSETKNRLPETYTIPNGYIGSFIIFYNISGAKTKKNNDTLVYDIPNTGILLTESDSNEGWVDTENLKYYYRHPNGDLIEIKERWTTSVIDTLENRTENKITIFGGGIGVIKPRVLKPTNNTRCELTYSSFYVGTKKDILDGVNYIDLLEIPNKDLMAYCERLVKT